MQSMWSASIIVKYLTSAIALNLLVGHIIHETVLLISKAREENISNHLLISSRCKLIENRYGRCRIDKLSVSKKFDP